MSPMPQDFDDVQWGIVDVRQGIVDVHWGTNDLREGINNVHCSTHNVREGSPEIHGAGPQDQVGPSPTPRRVLPTAWAGALCPRSS
jgi:hypothetical protein